MSYQRSFRPNQSRSRASLIVLIVLAFLLMIAAIVLALSIPDESSWQETSAPAFIQPVLDTGFDCTAVEAQTLFPFGQGVVRLAQNQITYLNIQGTELFSDELEMNAPFSIKAGPYLLAADRDGHSYAVITEQGVVYKGSLGGKIAGAALREDGHLALIEDQTDGHGVVRMFQPETGLKLYDCYFPESGYVLSVRFAYGQEAFDVALLNTNGSILQPVFKRYHMDGRELGQLMPDMDVILPLIDYNTDQAMVAVGMSELVGLAYEQDQSLYNQSFHQIQTLLRTEFALAVIANERFGGNWQLYLINEKGEPGIGLDIGDSVTPPASLDERLVIGSGTRLLVYDHKEKGWLMDQNLPAEIVRADFSAAGSLTVVTRSGVRRFQIES